MNNTDSTSRYIRDFTAPDPPEATRSSEEDKLDYEGSLSPVVLRRFAIYMREHKRLPNGQVRPCGDWKKGMKRERYMRSLWRHHMDLALHLGAFEVDDDVEQTLCAILFNAQAMLHEILIGRDLK